MRRPYPRLFSDPPATATWRRYWPAIESWRWWWALALRHADRWLAAAARVRRRRWVRVAVVSAIAVTLAATTAGLGYAAGVSLPDDPKTPQASVLYYSDGRTVLARLGVVNRTDVPLAQVPKVVRYAVLAAEDHQFYEHFGASFRGMARAVKTNLVGGSEGASTITQQYAKNAYLTQERTAGRKARELVLAIKLERRYTKDEILQRYLNTIYFGRRAYGIEAAAKAYFGITADQLTTAQGMVLAAVIKDPWGFDPAVDEEAARDRWRWIRRTMVDESWLSEAEAKRLTYPQVLPVSEASRSLGGPNGLVVDAVERELADHGIPPQVLRTGGLRVVTTIDARSQQAAVDRMSSMSAAAPGLRAALVAVDPAGGAVRAYFGGAQGQGFFDDAAAQRPPAATMKPLVLAAGLQRGVSYLSRWDASSPRMFAERGVPLTNRNGQQCPNCTLEEAMVRSLSTSYYALTEKVGAETVRNLAIDLGISPVYGERPALVDVKGDPSPGRTRADIALGRYPVSPADLASVYATLAAGGVWAARHFVESVTGIDGERHYVAGNDAKRVLDAGVAADVTTVLHGVAARHGQPQGHAAAAIAGSQQWRDSADNQDAWIAGYTPQLASVVWVGAATPGPIRDAAGAPISGEGLPNAAWQGFMSDALREKPAQTLPPPAHVGRTDVGDAGKAGRDTDATKDTRAGTGGVLVDYTAASGKALALTFDDGPAEQTEAILDVLKQHGVKATFCVVGEQVAERKATVRRIVAEGHALCNHSMRHDDLTNATPQQVTKDLTDAVGAIRDAVPGAKVAYFRAPGANWGVSAGVGAQLGMTPLSWSVDPEDWKQPGAGAIVQAVRQQLKQRGVVLLHDGGGDRAQTVQALKTLIPQLLSDGWRYDLPATTVEPITPPVQPAPTTSAPGTSGPLQTDPQQTQTRQEETQQEETQQTQTPDPTQGGTTGGEHETPQQTTSGGAQVGMR